MAAYSAAGAFTAQFASTDIVWPGGVGVEVESFSFSDRGGCDAATLAVSGDVEQLSQLFALLGREVRIYNTSGDLVWWGLVYSADLGFGVVGAGASLERMANNVRVEYTERDAFGGSESKATEWTGSPSSQARYGVKERSESIGEGNPAMALARRTQMLARLAWPRPRRTTGGGGAGSATATVRLRGVWHFQSWTFYANLVGRIENVGGGGDLALVIGAKLTSSSCGFVRRRMGDTEGQLGWLLEGDKVFISGAAQAGNNGDKNVTEPADPALPQTYTANTISFEPNDDILDAANGFGFVQTKNWISVAGSTSNSGVKWAREGDEGQIEIAAALTGNVAGEAAGPSVSIKIGHSVAVAQTTPDELPGAAITLQSYNEQLAQRFTAPASMTLKRLAVKVGKHGAPADNLLVELCADNGTGDYPGAVLSTVTIAPSALPADEVIEQWFACNQAVSAGAMYWLKFRRSGAATHAAYYFVGLIAYAGPGSTRGYNGTTWNHVNDWRPSNPPYSIAFRLHDAEDTSASIARIVAQCGQSFVTGVSVAATGVEHNQWADGEATGLAEIERLLDIGTAAGLRLVAHVNLLRSLVVQTEAAEPGEDFDLPVLGVDEQLYTNAGTLWPAGVNPVGQWVRLAGVPKMAGLSYRLSPDYIRAAEYDVQDGRWRIALRDDDNDIEGL